MDKFLHARLYKIEKAVKAIPTNINLSVWACVWTVGFLFNLGFVTVPSSFYALTFIEQVYTILANYILWPVVLGDYLHNILVL